MALAAKNSGVSLGKSVAGRLLNRYLCSPCEKIAGMRIPYKKPDEAFTEDQLVAKEPIAQFEAWFKEALETPAIEEANAMCLATASKAGRPSARMVLLKGFDQTGFKFFTNYESRKAREILENPFGSLNFHWEPLKRCIRIEGRIEKISEQESEEYFLSRPLSSQVGAATSPQSQVIPNREFLTIRHDELYKEAEKNGMQKPKNWGGFVLIPDFVEFWQGQSNRLHDRIRFRKANAGEVVDEKLVHQGSCNWVFERLAP